MRNSTSSNSQNREVIAVSELNKRARKLLEGQFGQVWVQGELSNVVRAASGHWYFTLKDRNGQLRCAMFRNRNRLIRFKPQEGEQVILRGKLSIYEGRGDYQLITEFMEAAGSGALQLALEQLKTQLHSEGLFDQDRKKALPSHAAHIIVISSSKGAAIHDVISVFKRRDPSIRLTLIPVAVQGEHAAAQITNAIHQANQYAPKQQAAPEAIILTRGGGAIEDLWAFNDEKLVRAIADSALPVVSAVGHETDTTLADLVADQRAPTPSAAAEVLSPDQSDVLARFISLEQRLCYIQHSQLRARRNELDKHRGRMQHPGQRLQNYAQRADELQLRLNSAFASTSKTKELALTNVKSRLLQQDPKSLLQQLRQRLENQNQRLQQLATQQLRDKRSKFEHSMRILNTLSPLATVDRGFAIVRDDKNRLIRDANQVKMGDIIEAQLGTGRIKSVVSNIDS